MSHLNRRRFLEESLLSAAATGAAAFALQSPLVRAESPSPVSSNEKLGVCIVGAGSRGNDHIKGFGSDPRTTILYLCDVDTKSCNDEKLNRIAATQDGVRPKVVADMRRAFEDKAVDLVSCATTNHWHTLCGIWAVQAGKSCYLEKPISHNMHEGFAIEAASKKYNKVVQTGSQTRSSRALLDAVAFIREGGIGDVRFARGLCYKRRKAIGPKGVYRVPETVDYDLWSGPAAILPVTRPNFHYDWHWQREYGNGDLGNQGPHQTDISRWFLDVDRYPRAVLSYGGRLGYQAEMKDDNYVDAGDTANTEVSIYDYGDKCMVFETRGLESARLMCPNGKDPKKAGAMIGVIAYGSKGYMVQVSYSYCAAFDLDGNLIKEFKGGGDHYGNFIDAVLAGDPSKANATARTGALSAAVSHMGNISYYLGEANKVGASEIESALKGIKSLDDDADTLARTIEHLEANKVDLKKYPLSLGRLLKFDPEKLVFSDPDAQKLATREYRNGFVVPDPKSV